MNRVEQRTKTDCGVACVAMLAGVTYEQARAVMPRGPTRAADCIKALRKLGMKVDRFLPLGPDPVESLSAPALIKANKRRTQWHWVVYDPGAKQVLDPWKLPNPPYNALAYLPVLRSDKPQVSNK